MMINKLLSYLYQYLNHFLLITVFVLIIYLLIFVDRIPESVSEKKMIKVYVCGEVQNPGVYELPLGSRVQDVLILSKVKDNADLNSINLAKRLRDEDMIKVYPLEKEKIRINVNTANLEELSKLPGISNKVAKEIIQYRERYGNFTNINELLRVKGMSVEDLEEISKYIEF